MKLKIVISIFIVMMFVFGCVPVDVNEGDNLVEKEPEAPVEEILVEEELEPVEPVIETCEDKAIALIPKTFNLTIASNFDSNIAAWNFGSEVNWTDGTAMDTKGSIDFRKGQRVGDNPSYWYTWNTKNEKLFGEGGLKYYKKFANEDGIASTLEFIIKPILKPVRIVKPKLSLDPHTGIFEIVDYGFVECTSI